MLIQTEHKYLRICPEENVQYIYIYNNNNTDRAQIPSYLPVYCIYIYMYVCMYVYNKIMIHTGHKYLCIRPEENVHHKFLELRQVQ